MRVEPSAPLHPLLRGALDVASLAFKTGAALARIRRRLARRSYPSLFVVSVDNLSFGGTGKTPFLIALGEELQRRGLRFAVVCRGYRSRLERAGGRVEAGHGPADVGDEALLLASRFPRQDVFLGRDRHRSLRRAAEGNHAIAILDDGFQSADIAKDYSVMLLHPGHPFFYLRHFPAAAAAADRLLCYRRVPARWAGRALAYDFELEGLFDGAGNPVDAAARPLAAFSALADNERFRSDLAARFPLVAFRPFADHHAFTPGDLDALERWRLERGAAALVCSEKDFVKLRFLPGAAAMPFLHTRNRIQLHPDVLGDIVRHAEEKGRRQA